jgi:hypothetical protein
VITLENCDGEGKLILPGYDLRRVFALCNGGTVASFRTVCGGKKEQSGNSYLIGLIAVMA